MAEQKKGHLEFCVLYLFVIDCLVFDDENINTIMSL
jgi:hypothetical protein